MRPKNQDIQTEISKVKYYIMSLVYRGSNLGNPLPSSRELAEQFSLSRSTIRDVLRILCNDGWLITRRGIGTFINPERIFSSGEGDRPRLIGIKQGSGDNYFRNGPAVRALVAVMLELVNRNYNVHLLHADTPNADRFRQELDSSFIDGVLCLNSPAELGREAALTHPTVMVDCFAPGVPSVTSDYSTVLQTLLKLLGRRRTRPHITVCGLHESNSIAVFLQKSKHCELTFAADSNMLKHQLSLAVPDCIIADSQRFQQIHEVLAHQHIPRSVCAVVLNSQPCFAAPCEVFDLPRVHLCRLVVDRLVSLLENRVIDNMNATVGYELKSYYGGNDHDLR